MTAPVLPTTPAAAARKPMNNWVKIIGFSFITLVFLFAYDAIQHGSFDIYTLNRSLALNALVLIGSSMGLASAAYFFHGLQRKIVYRVNLGVVGFFYALVHGLMSDFFYFFDKNAPWPNYQFDKVWPIIGGLTISNVVAFILGTAALLVFAFMALISLKYFIVRLGTLWRKLLRYLGFTALTFVLVHFFIKSADIWLHPSSWQNLPPMTLWLWLCGLIILILRLLMWRKLAAKKAAIIKAQ